MSLSGYHAWSNTHNPQQPGPAGPQQPTKHLGAPALEQQRPGAPTPVKQQQQQQQQQQQSGKTIMGNTNNINRTKQDSSPLGRYLKAIVSPPPPPHGTDMATLLHGLPGLPRPTTTSLPRTPRRLRRHPKGGPITLPDRSRLMISTSTLTRRA
jgi:hypothetical protein